MHIKEAEYGSILYQCSKGPDKSKKQGDVQSDKKAADLFWYGGTDRSTVIFSDEDSNEDQYGSYGNDDHYDAILFPCHVREKRTAAGSHFEPYDTGNFQKAEDPSI